MHALPSGVAPLSPAVARALRTARAHDGVDGVGTPRVDAAGFVVVDIRFRPGLPVAWSAAGRSPNGVLAVEPVTFTFPPDYPFRPPCIELRGEFDRSLAHVQPGPPSERPQPCVYDGLLGDLLAARGFGEILNQTLDWLEKAATGRLIDPAQGWEPVRRDTLSDIVVADAPALRAMVGRKPGHAWLGFDYLIVGAPSASDVAYRGTVGTKRVQFNRDTFSSEDHGRGGDKPGPARRVARPLRLAGMRCRGQAGRRRPVSAGNRLDLGRAGRARRRVWLPRAAGAVSKAVGKRWRRFRRDDGIGSGGEVNRAA